MSAVYQPLNIAESKERISFYISNHSYTELIKVSEGQGGTDTTHQFQH